MKILLLILLCFPLYILAQSENPLVIQPSISPDGKQIAFSFQGDIWTMPIQGGQAIRLTIHEGYESRPLWSPDGLNIAFSSDRNGNNDVFVIPSRGGNPKQLTFFSGSDVPVSWDGNDAVLFLTRRLYAQVEREFEIYRVSTTGGTASRHSNSLAMEAVYAPDHKALALGRGICGLEREAYKGPANRDIWIYFPNEDLFKQLTDFEGNDFNIRWYNDQTIYYLSATSGRYNIHKLKLSADKKAVESKSKLTDINGNYGITSFDLSKDGKTIIYQVADELFVMSTENNKSQKIKIELGTDYRFDPIIKKTFTKSDEYAVSPNGKWIATAVHGELFITANDKDETRTVRITNTADREQQPVWLNDHTLIFSSDKYGHYDLFAISPADTSLKDLYNTLKFKITRLTKNESDEKNLTISPNSRRITFLRGRAELIVADIDSVANITNEKVLLSDWNTANSVSWSPDSRWLAYAQTDLSFNDEVFIHHASDSFPRVNVSMHPRGDNNPMWSKDGSKLAFVSDRNNGDNDIWFCWLKESDYLKSKEEWKREEFVAKDEKKDKDKKDKNVQPVKIDFENIHNRLQQVTAYPSNESDYKISNDGKTFFYINSRDGRKDYNVDPSLCQIKWDGTDQKQLVEGKQSPKALEISVDGETVYFLNNNNSIQVLKVKDAKTESRNISAKMEINYNDELKQIFNEAWRALEAGFYDPEFHGQDWKKLRKLYEPLCFSASTKEDFQYFFNQMLGQLNASHMGLFNGDNPKSTQTSRTGLIGVEIIPTDKGVKVTKVLKGSPASKPESLLRVGEVIQSVNGKDIKSNIDFNALLDETAGERVLLQVLDEKANNREVVIWPVASLNNELYEDWVRERARLTNEYSNGKLGYLHIQGMDWKSFEKFERELMAAGYGKEGIVIDVRYNGGGWTTDYLMAILTVRQHSYTIPRGATENLKEHKKFKDYYPYGERLPFAAWTKPTVAICNESSYSNAEIFSHAYKELKLGTLVGKSTYGAVISTGAYNLIDGSLVRMPFRGWFVKSSGLNMENGPAVPDMQIEISPDYKAKGKDEQLKKAVETLMEKKK